MRTEDQRGGRSRRAVLRSGAGIAVAALGLTGCDLLSGDTEPPPAPDPLLPLLTGTTDLIARYDAALAARPELAARLAPIRAAHVAHAAELARLTGAPASTAPPGATPPGATPPGATPPGTSPSGTAGPSAAPSPSGSPSPAPDAKATLAALRTAEQIAQRPAFDACLAAPPVRAALLGSIAAARASHAEALR